MNSIFSPTSCLPMTPAFHQLKPKPNLQPVDGCFNKKKIDGGQHSSVLPRFPYIWPIPLRDLQPTCRGATAENEGTVSVLDFEELMEKDWSFLDFIDKNYEEQHNQKIDQIISAGEIGETSNVLISIGSEDFVDRVARVSPSEHLLVVHDSLFTLACIKEKFDNVKCWQGELIYLPENWVALDVVFLYFLPALPFQLRQILETLSKHCLPGARIVISHLQGRLTFKEQQKKYPDIVVSELPDKITLQEAAADHLFQLVKFVDGNDFYLAVLKFKENY